MERYQIRDPPLPSIQRVHAVGFARQDSSSLGPVASCDPKAHPERRAPYDLSHHLWLDHLFALVSPSTVLPLLCLQDRGFCLSLPLWTIVVEGKEIA